MFIDEACFLIVGAAAVGDELALLGDWMGFFAQVTSGAARWSKCRGRPLHLLRLRSNPQLAACWQWESEDVVVVLEF